MTTTADLLSKALRKIPTITLNTIEDVAQLIADQQLNANIDRYRSSYLYRGLPNAAYSLLTTLQRNCKHKQCTIEKPILRNFAKYAISEDPQINESVWRQMVIGQHHGLPTRLLDWSYSPLVALHFATSGEDLGRMEEHDCVVWKIDIDEIHSLLPKRYCQVLKDEHAFLFTVDMLEGLTEDLDDYDSAMGDRSFVILEPPSIDQRIINQYSYFSVTPSDISCMEEFLANNTIHTTRYIIKNNLRWQVRDMLDKVNMNERIMFPGLDGLTAWLKRHYYVK